MVKKIISLILIFAMSNLYANSLPTNLVNLETAFNDYNFAVSVEWDQKDKKFYNEQVNKLKDSVKKLQENGLTKDELIEFASRQMTNEKMAKELREMISQVELSKMSASEARKFVMESIAKDSSSGANWAGDGEVLMWLMAGIVIVLVIAVVAALGSVSSGSTTSGGSTGGSSGGGDYTPTCYDEYVCYDYYDSQGYWLYEDCFYETFCY